MFTTLILNLGIIEIQYSVLIINNYLCFDNLKMHDAFEYINLLYLTCEQNSLLLLLLSRSFKFKPRPKT